MYMWATTLLLVMTFWSHLAEESLMVSELIDISTYL